MFVHTAVIFDLKEGVLKGFFINQKLLLSISEYHYYYQGRKWNMSDFWNRHNHSLSLKFIGSFEAAAFSQLLTCFFPPSRFSLLSSGRSLCCLPHFAPTASRKKRVAKFSVLWAQCEALGFIKHYGRTWNFTRRRTKVNSPSADWLSYLGT